MSSTEEAYRVWHGSYTKGFFSRVRKTIAKTTLVDTYNILDALPPSSIMLNATKNDEQARKICI
jgi:hypothetical protein